MTALENITKLMRNLEVEISRQQAYISKHGVSNDAGDFDLQWEQYKKEAKENLNKWDFLKNKRDEIKISLVK